MIKGKRKQSYAKALTGNSMQGEKNATLEHIKIVISTTDNFGKLSDY